VLQLRHHEAIEKLRNEVAANPTTTPYEVELTYITSRGRWYHESWKGDPRRSHGLATNIGVHFFDMLHYVFGKLTHSELHLSTPYQAAGYLSYERANVRWFLSIDANDLPANIRGKKPTYRHLSFNGQTFEFSEGFTDLHTATYREVLQGRGYGIDDAHACISIVEHIRGATPITPNHERAHPQLHDRTLVIR